MKRAAFLLSLLVCACAGAEDMTQSSVGRLFLTPAERARREALKTQAHAEAQVETPLPAREPRRYQGWVRRGNGATAWWVDGAPVTIAPPEAAWDLLRGGRVAPASPRQNRQD
ncbi:MAG: hypothetical protein LBO79_09475 [Zoogloeaceae bacterium]|jgi:hypothetical protein|nr:hypothetical protein [Zoogloeaceae bacterium]